MMIWNSYIALAVLWLSALTPLSNPSSFGLEENTRPTQIPVLNVNVYMMGRTDVDAEVTILINENIDYLNQEFEGVIEFEFNELFMDHGQAYLPDLHKEYLSFSESKSIEELIKPIEKKGAINVFLFDTYSEEGTDKALMGFTPRLKTGEESYAKNSPHFDRIFMAYDGLRSKTTLVHEMGHFLGLHHPWELSHSRKYVFGIKTALDESQNHMSYGSSVCKFTSQQLESMRKHALNYRKYLMDRVVHTYAKS